MNKVRNIAIVLLAVGAIAGSFTIPRRDLRGTEQVAGIALDEVNGGICATFELYSLDDEQTIGKEKKVVVSEGETLADCIENAYRVHGKTLFANDAAVLILGGSGTERLLEAAFDYYRLLANDQMDLPVFFAEGEAGKILSGEGEVLSTGLARSGRELKRLQTVRDLMNGTGERVRIRGEGGYEIIS